MDDAPKRLVTWKHWVAVLLVLFGWAVYRLYRDYQAAGGFEESSVAATIVTLCIGLAIVVGMFWYANRPESKDKP
jgi:hypothetical protein